MTSSPLPDVGLLSLVLCALSSVNLLSGQTAQPPYTLKLGDIRTYEGFMRNIALISNKADELDLKGVKNGLRQGVCTKLSLSAADCAILFQVSVSVATQLQSLDQQATALIQQARQRSPQLVDKAAPPTPPDGLVQLQSQRDALVQSGIGGMTARMTPTGFSLIQGHVLRSNTARTGTTKNN